MKLKVEQLDSLRTAPTEVDGSTIVRSREGKMVILATMLANAREGGGNHKIQHLRSGRDIGNTVWAGYAAGDDSQLCLWELRSAIPSDNVICLPRIPCNSQRCTSHRRDSLRSRRRAHRWRCLCLALQLASRSVCQARLLSNKGPADPT